MLVMKFGGTSVADASRLKDVLKIISNQQIGVVVLSAMSGVTNDLIACAHAAQGGDASPALVKLAKLKDRHLKVVEELFSSGGVHAAITLAEQAPPLQIQRSNSDSKGRSMLPPDLEEEFDQLSVLVQGIAYLGELSKRSLDAISSYGELLSSKIFAAYAVSQNFPAQYLDARRFIITNDDFGRAQPTMPELIKACHSEILPLIKKGQWVITQGFIGATASGATTTLGRGGSDYTAALIGGAIEADEIQIWTDVDGMMTADPRQVPDARPVASISFQEASELAYFGAKVLHPLTIKPAVEKNIPVRILNTLKPDSPGTLIMQDKQTKEKSQETSKGNGKAAAQEVSVTAIATKKNLTAVFIQSPRMLMATGFVAEVFCVFARHQTAIDLIATSEVSVSLTIDNLDHLPEIEEDLKKLADVTVVHDLAIVSIVGRQFREQSGIASRIFKALAGINIVMISYGASEINLNFVVANKDADQAIKLLHAEFFQPVHVRSASGI